MQPTEPEAWLLGKIAGVPDALMPTAHSLEQARKELTTMQGMISTDECRISIGGAAPIGFHLAHIAGSLDRLFTYARGAKLNADQYAFLKGEREAGEGLSAATLFSIALRRIAICMDDLRQVSPDSIFEPREVGRARLPSTVIGLLFHAGEHTTMHVGQIRTTLKIIRGLKT